MFAIYENATHNEIPLRQLFVFDGIASVSYCGKLYENVHQIEISVKRGTLVKANAQPLTITHIKTPPKGARK